MYYTGLVIYWGVLPRIIAILVRVETGASTCTYGLVALGSSSVLAPIVDIA